MSFSNSTLRSSPSGSLELNILKKMYVLTLHIHGKCEGIKVSEKPFQKESFKTFFVLAFLKLTLSLVFFFLIYLFIFACVGSSFLCEDFL